MPPSLPRSICYPDKKVSNVFKILKNLSNLISHESEMGSVIIREGLEQQDYNIFGVELLFYDSYRKIRRILPVYKS